MHTLLTLPMGCAIFSLKLIPQTVEAEITAVMPSQRACDAENQARYTLSNGPLRVQRNAFYAQSILQRVGIRQLPGDMMVSPPSARVTVNSRWHRGSFVSLVSHSSLTVYSASSVSPERASSRCLSVRDAAFPESWLRVLSRMSVTAV